MDKYKIAKWVVIGIILICLLLILFKPQIKRWINNNSNDGFTTNGVSDNILDDDLPSITNTTGATTTTTGATTTTTGAMTTTTGATTTTTGPTIPISDDYGFTAAGYIPLLDIVMTRIILLQVWLSDMAELQKTGLPRATLANETEQNTTSGEESFADVSTNDMLYPQIYPTFEDFFTAEFQNIPRLNIFIERTDTRNLNKNMTIILSTFAKPNWVIKIAKFYRSDKVDDQTLNAFLNELVELTPEDRENNSSNLVLNSEIGGLATITIPISLRAKIDRLRTVLGEYYINLTVEPNDEMAPDFYKNTLGLLRFITMNTVLISLLYMNINDDDTIEMLELETRNNINVDAEGIGEIFDKDAILKPSLVPDRRRTDALGFANILGYKSSVVYNITLLTMDNQILPNGLPGTSLLANHTRQIAKVAKLAILQNPKIATAIPDKYIIDEKLTTITDNIYSYYFDINKKYTNEYGDTFGKSSIFQFRLKPFLLPLYANLPNYYELLASKENALKDTSLPNDKKLAIQMELDTINQNIQNIETNTPYMIYLPIYDFQYIKIVPRLTKGELPVSDGYKYRYRPSLLRSSTSRLRPLGLPKLPSSKPKTESKSSSKTKSKRKKKFF